MSARQQALANRGVQWSHVSKDTSTQVYYYLNIQNNSLTESMLAEFSETRTDPLLLVPSDYYCTLVSFSVPGGEIPIFQHPDDAVQVTAGPPPTYAQGILSVTLQSSVAPNRLYETPLVYVAANNAATTAEDYRWVFSYQQFIDEINFAFATSMAAMIVTEGNAPGSCAAAVGSIPPYMTYDRVTNQVALFTPQTYVTQTNPAPSGGVLSNGPKIFFSQPLYDFFPSMNARLNTGANTTNQYAQPLVANTGNNNVSLQGPSYGLAGVAPPTGLGYAMYQQYPTLYDWNEFREIVFETANIPVAVSQIPDASSPGNAAFRPILTAYQVLQDTGLEPRSIIQFAPTAEFRLIDMQSETPLRTIDLRVSWTDQFQIQHPIRIPPSGILQAVILFRKKSFNGLPDPAALKGVMFR